MQLLTQKRFQNQFKISFHDQGSTIQLNAPHELFALSLMLKENSDTSFDQLLDIFCSEEAKTNHLYYLFKNSKWNRRLTLIALAPKGVHIPSLSSIYESANWLERECFDLSGIRFEGHPDLKRLLLYPEFAGHPLNKNYPIDKEQARIPIYA